uniref:Uncharacterized protein n=1 Tax=Leersia perrieri TaxID=77586 RepID=A0A0D9XZB1_9ORYZ
MASGDGVKKRAAWVADLERDLAGATAESEFAIWKSHSVHRVPAAVKALHPHAYRPQVVSLGPFHHADPRLLPMESHKRRAVARLVARCSGTTSSSAALDQLVAAMMRTAEVYAAAGGGGGGGDDGEYKQRDPVFGRHGKVYMVPYVRRDMLIVDNQLPLLVLEKLVAVERRIYSQTMKVGVEYQVKKMVLRFISPSCKSPPPAKDEHRALHPLDVFRKSLLSDKKPRDGAGTITSRRHHDHNEDDEASSIIRSASELYEAGIRFKRSKTDSLHDISFRHGVLSLPSIIVDDSTEYMFLNLMAFERLHAGSGGGNDVTAYVFFMDNIIDSAADVALLTSKGIIQNAVGSDKAVASLFNGLAKDVVLDTDSELDAVQRMVNRYCRKPCNMWRANLVHTYFRSPWAFLSLAAALFLLAMAVLQTVYTVLSFYRDNGGGTISSSPPSAPAPR